MEELERLYPSICEKISEHFFDRKSDRFETIYFESIDKNQNDFEGAVKFIDERGKEVYVKFSTGGSSGFDILDYEITTPIICKSQILDF